MPLDSGLIRKPDISSSLEAAMTMFKHSLTLAVGYLLFGLIISFLARKGRPEAWDETILASVLGPPLAILILTVVLGNLVWSRLTGSSAGGAERRRLQ